MGPSAALVELIAQSALLTVAYPTPRIPFVLVVSVWAIEAAPKSIVPLLALRVMAFMRSTDAPLERVTACEPEAMVVALTTSVWEPPLSSIVPCPCP